MSARSYLSIGDVLTLLRQEFPDVTISKIRFLESQGLVNPERTPSGYRKFYEHDVERLRWVLRQQREHFLPLKVIKDRLDEDGTTPAAAEAASPAANGSAAAADDTPDGPTAAPAPAEAPVLVSATAEAPAPAASRVAERATVAAGAPVRSGGTPPAAASPKRPVTAVRTAEPQVANGSGNGAVAHDQAAPEPPHPADEAAPSEEPVATAAPAPKPARAPRSAKAAPARTGGGDDGAPVDLASAGGASLSVDDLCAASGLTVEEVVQLQEYGLLSATVAAGVEFFDEEGLIVANLAAKFAAFGIEARHLRLYKNAAEREAGFIEQIVIPMVRQRNPEARARATQTAEDLARLGQQLRGSLLRSTLRELLAP